MRSLMNVLLLGNQGAAAAPSPLLTDLYDFWSFEEVSGNRTGDYAGHVLTDTNTVGQAAGKVDNAASFVAAQKEYLKGANITFGDQDFEACGWVYLTSEVSSVIVGQYDYGDNNRCWRLLYSPVSDRFEFSISRDGTIGTTTTVVANTFGAVSVDTWYFFSVRYDAAGNLATLQINTSADAASHSGGAFTGNEGFAVGMNFSATTLQQPLDGRVDQLLLRVGSLLESDDRTWLYNSGNGRSYAEIVAYTGP